MKGDAGFYAFNRGKVSRLAMARIDLKRIAISAAEQTNWSPKELGPMSLRVGTEYIAATDGSVATKQIPFIFASDDTAMVDVTTASIRVRVDDVFVTRAAVTAAISNGLFGTDLTGWTDADEGATSSAWVTGGYMGLTGDGTQSAIRRQSLTINETSTEHALRIIVQRGPVTLRVGSTSGGDEYIEQTALETGTHSLAFTPTATPAYIEFSNRENRLALLDSVAVEGSGIMELPAPWATLSKLRWDQSGDVLFVADGTLQQRRIERRDTNSWSIVKYQSASGPFRVPNVTATTLTPSALSGNITITASRPTFRSTHVGALYSISSIGQTVTAALSAENTFTNSVEVNGFTAARAVGIVITGTFTATVTLQRSFDNVTWGDVGGVYAWSAAVSTAYNDELENQIAYYRIGIKTGDYTSGTATCTLVVSAGSITGVARITDYTSTTVVGAEVLTEMGGTSASDIWSEGAWSDYRGWPSAVVLHEGRLWWAGKDKFWGSVTDIFDNFDPDYVGDAGPISRSIGSGPVDSVAWLVSLGRLLAGTDGSVVIPRSSSFDEPLTPTNFNPKAPVTKGSARVVAVKVDDAAIYVQRSGFRVIELAIDPSKADYAPVDLTELVPEIGEPGIIAMASQREPDTRVHCVRSDGTVAILVYNRVENVICWWEYETDGDVEDVAVLPGTDEDLVYYIVKRVINGATVRYIEKWAFESECVGGTLNKQADSFTVWTGPGTTVTGADHLEGESVVVWADGLDVGPKTVTSGSFNLDTSATNVVYGLGYQARFKSTKLAYVAQPGSIGMTQKKRINTIAPVMVDTHAQGLRFGPDFSTLSYMPEVEGGVAIDLDSIWDEYDYTSTPFQGKWSTDSRLCLVADAPRPCTLIGVVIDMESHQK
jgi:hypothetical protein